MPRAGGASVLPRPSPAGVVLLLNRHSEFPLDLGHDALVCVEELRRDLLPATELGDGEQPRRLGEVLARRVDTLDDWTVAVLREDFLCLRSVDEVQELLGFLGVLAVARDGRWVLDQQG